jgi:hypothetical protein
MTVADTQHFRDGSSFDLPFHENRAHHPVAPLNKSPAVFFPLSPIDDVPPQLSWTHEP